MNIHPSIVDLLDFLSLVQGIILGSVLILQNKKKQPSIFLGFFLIFYTSDLIRSLLKTTGIANQNPFWYFLPVNSYFLALPLFYFYTKSLIGQFNWRKHVRWLIPGIIEFLVFLRLFLLTTEQKIYIRDHTNVRIYYSIYQFVSILFSIFIIGLIIRLINRHQKDVLEYYSDTNHRQLKWIRIVVIAILVYDLLVIWEVFTYHPELGHRFDLFYSGFNVIFIYWIAISGLRQPMALVLSQKDSTENLDSGSQNSDIAESSQKEKLATLIQMINQQQLYKIKDLTLPELAIKVGYSRRRLSQLINQEAGTNFNNFINQFRINEAKVMLENPEFDYLNMVGIADEVGFNSKATFFAVFKKLVGSPPAKYKADQNQKMKTK